MFFKNHGFEGSYVPFIGRWEWSKLSSNNDATFVISSLMLRVSPDANFLVKIVNNVMPDPEAVLNFNWSVLILEQRRKWIEKTYRATTLNKI